MRQNLDYGGTVQSVKDFRFLLSFSSLVISFLLLISGLALAQESSGASTFKTKCVLCHGADGTGNTPLGKQLQAANLRSKEVQQKTDTELRQVIHDGKGNMPPFSEQLSDDQIDQVLKYVRMLGKQAKK